jgi:nucleoside-diphosphate-sugar epimerase
MKVLVTGANGFLASHVIAELLKRGYFVRGMDRGNQGALIPCSANYERVVGELTQSEDINRAVEGCDAIVHVAANTSQRVKDEKIRHQVNVEATRMLLDAAKTNRIRRFVFVSTANTIGYGSATNPGNESFPIGSAFRRSGYALSKQKAEEMVLSEVNNSNLEAVIVNPTFMIGPYDSKPSSGKILLMFHNRSHIFLTSGGKNFIHVRDVATGVCQALEKGRKGERYLLGNENLTYSRFFKMATEASGLNQKQVVIPRFLLIAVGMVTDCLRKLGLQTELSAVNARILCIRNYYDCSKAVSELNLPQTPVQNAIQEALDWFTTNGFLKHHKTHRQV